MSLWLENTQPTSHPRAEYGCIVLVLTITAIVERNLVSSKVSSDFTIKKHPQLMRIISMGAIHFTLQMLCSILWSIREILSSN